MYASNSPVTAAARRERDAEIRVLLEAALEKLEAGP
jgi:hypothetical protein